MDPLSGLAKNPGPILNQQLRGGFVQKLFGCFPKWTTFWSVLKGTKDNQRKPTIEIRGYHYFEKLLPHQLTRNLTFGTRSIQKEQDPNQDHFSEPRTVPCEQGGRVLPYSNCGGSTFWGTQKGLHLKLFAGFTPWNSESASM